MNRIPTEKEFEKIMDKRFTPEIHKALKNAKVAIAGLGGLGSNIAVMLARSGVGHLHLVDFDIVDISNLNRQIYSIPHIGQFKTEALKAVLSEINPYITVTTQTMKVIEDNVALTFGEFPIVCEAFDKSENKAMLVNALLSECPHTKVVSGTGLAGYGSSNTIQTRKVMTNLYLCGDGSTDVDDGIGLFAPRVAICAGHEANMVIRLILGINEV